MSIKVKKVKSSVKKTKKESSKTSIKNKKAIKSKKISNWIKKAKKEKEIKNSLKISRAINNSEIIKIKKIDKNIIQILKNILN